MGNICQPNEDLSKEGGSNYNKFNNQQQAQKVTMENFRALKIIGRGAFGKVMLVEKKSDNQLFAMKIMTKAQIKQRNQVQHIFAEKQIMSQANNLFIVKLHYAFQTNEKLHLVLDFLNGGELFFHLKNSGRFSESKAKFYIAEILLALHYLHGKGIIYRDLKPENVLLDSQGHVRITDFGLSKEGLGEGQLTNTFVGTPEYLAPEIILNKGHDKSVDYWTVGALLYEMLTGAPPFYYKKRQQLYRAIVNNQVKMRSHFSPEACSLLKSLLTQDPSKRLGSKSFDEIKTHQFFKQIDWEKLQQKQISPPFKPNIKNERDLKYFDTMFTKEEIKDTPSSIGKMAQTMAFQGFTYDPNHKQHQKMDDDDEEEEENQIQEKISDEEDEEEDEEEETQTSNEDLKNEVQQVSNGAQVSNQQL